MFKITAIGSDPEFVLLDEQNKPVSAIGLQGSSEDVSVYADNVLAEFNHDPFEPKHFVQGMKAVLKNVDKVLSGFNKKVHYQIGQCEAQYDVNQLNCPEAHKIGCEPFLSAYDLDCYQTPQPYQNNSRFAGGHIHIAYDTETLPPHMLVKLLDERLLPLDPNHNKTQRSEFYGAKGAFRPKPYGLEYRAVSNWWLDNPQLVLDVLMEIEKYVNDTYYGD